MLIFWGSFKHFSNYLVKIQDSLTWAMLQGTCDDRSTGSILYKVYLAELYIHRYVNAQGLSDYFYEKWKMCGTIKIAYKINSNIK